MTQKEFDAELREEALENLEMNPDLKEELEVLGDMENDRQLEEQEY